jgi:hypothetical protein
MKMASMLRFVRLSRQAKSKLARAVAAAKWLAKSV